MRPVVRCFTFLLGLCFSASASAATGEESSGHVYKDVEITPLVRHFEKDVKTLTQSVMMYNWTRDGGNPLWAQERPQGDPLLLQRAREVTSVFWDHYGQPSYGNMYGWGLYGAVDPVYTFMYGGGHYNFAGANPLWVVLELKLPVGFRMALASYSNVPSSDPVVRDLLEKFDCPADATVNSMMMLGGEALRPSCQELSKAIFRDILKIDGLAYEYGGTPFKACEGEGYGGQKAFVITNPGFLKPEYIKFFNAKSTLDVETRIRIQTLFLLAIQDQQDHLGNVKAKLVDYMKSHDNTFVAGSTTRCEGSTCVITVKFCNLANDCEDVALDPLPRPGGGVITSEEASRSAAGSLLWPDLQGKAKTATISSWLKENKFACSGTLPYSDSGASK